MRVKPILVIVACLSAVVFGPSLGCSSNGAGRTDAGDADSDAGVDPDGGDRQGGADADGDAEPAAYYYPPLAPADDTWETVSPESLGWDPVALEDAITYVGDHNSTAFLILYQGRILVERYWQGWDAHSEDRIFSAGKSMTAVLVGLAREGGLVDVEAPISTYLAEGWSAASVDQESTITVRHLLTMTSGLDEDLGYVGLAGSIWFYNTTAYRLLLDVIEAASGLSRTDFSRDGLWDPIGLKDTRFTVAGNVVRASGRDMCRFGLLVLSGGRWDGRTVIGDDAYLAAMLDSSQQLNPAYGYLWWLNGKPAYILPGDPPVSGQGAVVPSAPADAVAALGLGDKKIYVVPSADLVMCRHGDSALGAQFAKSEFDDVLWQKISAAMPSGQ